VKLQFYAKAHFLGVIGGIDCMHVQGHRQKNFQGGQRNKRTKNSKKHRKIEWVISF